MKPTPHSTGLSPPPEALCHQPAASTIRPPGAAWISDVLIEETQRVWSRAYGRPISVDEAIEIISNIKRLAEVLFQDRRSQQP